VRVALLKGAQELDDIVVHYPQMILGPRRAR
jgi:hypothetical protein